MCEWTTGKTEVPIFHINGKHNLADLLTKKHELSVESVTLNSVWENGLPWMRMDTKSMPLLAYDQLRVKKTYRTRGQGRMLYDAMTG